MSLYRETLCEQCGELYGEHDGPVTDDCQGSGGSREEVTVDIHEAAYIINELAFGRIMAEPLSNHVMNIATQAISAAIGDNE